MEQPRKISQYQDLQDATLAEKLMLGIPGFNQESNSKRYELAATLEQQRRDLDRSNEEMDYSQALLLEHHGDIQRGLNHRDPFEQYPAEPATASEIQNAVEQLHRDHGMKFSIRTLNNLYHAPVAQQISLGIEGNRPEDQSARFRRAQVFEEYLESRIDEVRAESERPGSNGFELDVEPGITEDEYKLRYPLPFGVAANLDAKGDAEKILATSAKRSVEGTANEFERHASQAHVVTDLQQSEVISSNYSPEQVSHSSAKSSFRVDSATLAEGNSGKEATSFTAETQKHPPTTARPYKGPFGAPATSKTEPGTEQSGTGWNSLPKERPPLVSRPQDHGPNR